MALPSWTPINGNITLTPVKDYGVGNATLAALRNLQEVQRQKFEADKAVEALAFRQSQRLAQDGANYMEGRRKETIAENKYSDALALEAQRYKDAQARKDKEFEALQTYRKDTLAKGNKAQGKSSTRKTKHTPAVDTYKDVVEPFVMPDVTSKQVSVNDTDRLLAVNPDEKAIEKLTKEAVKQYNFEASKYKGKPLVNLDNDILAAYEKLQAIPKNSGEYRLEATKLADMVNTKENRVPRSFWDSISGEASPYQKKKSALEKELGLSTYAFAEFKSPKAFLDYKLKSKNGAHFRKNPKVTEYIKLLDTPPIEKDTKPYTAEEVITGINNSRKLDKLRADIDKRFDPMTSSAYTKEYAKKVVTVPTTPEEQLQALQDIRANLVKKTSSNDSDLFNVIADIESKGNYNAQNPNTSAHGKYQFTNKTEKWLQDILHMTKEEIKTPAGQEKAMRELTNRNINVLKKLRVPVTPFNIYGVHQLGTGNFTNLVNGNMTPTLKQALRNNLTKAENKATKDEDLANVWSQKYKTLVESKIKDPAKVNMKAIKGIDSKIASLNKALAKSSDDKAKAKAKKREQDVKTVGNIKKQKLEAAKAQFEADSQLYRQMMKDGSIKKGTPQPLLQDYIDAVKTSTPYIYKPN